MNRPSCIFSPKVGVHDKRHHDYIDEQRLMKFLHEIKGSIHQFDVVIEAKQKDEALFRLMKRQKDRDECTIHSMASIVK